MAGASDLHDLCVEWLAVCAEAVASTAEGAIARSFVAPGLPAFDCCPQLTVHAGGALEGDTLPLSPPLVTGERTSYQGAVHLINLTATAIRCAPFGGEDESGGIVLPEAAELEAAAKKMNDDVWAIWNYTANRHRDGLLFSSPSGKRELFLDPAFPVQTAGGCGGWQIPIRVALGGYRVST